MGEWEPTAEFYRSLINPELDAEEHLDADHAGVGVGHPEGVHRIGQAARLAHLEEGIAAACESAGRERSAVRLIAVSKTHPLEAVKAAYALGLRDFGESYAQELVKKREDLGASLPDLRWHFIGRVQTNKAKILAQADLVHGVGSIAHAEALAKRADLFFAIRELFHARHEEGVRISRATSFLPPSALRRAFYW